MSTVPITANMWVLLLWKAVAIDVVYRISLCLHWAVCGTLETATPVPPQYSEANARRSACGRAAKRGEPPIRLRAVGDTSALRRLHCLIGGARAKRGNCGDRMDYASSPRGGWRPLPLCQSGGRAEVEALFFAARWSIGLKARCRSLSRSDAMLR